MCDGGMTNLGKKKFALFGLIFLTCTVSGCGSKDNTLSASTIFTPQIKDAMTEIIYYANDDGVKLKDKEDMDEIYDLLSSLSLTEASKDGVKVDGGIDMEIVTDESTLKFHMTSKIISINNVIYLYDDKDVLSNITKIYEPYL